MTVAVICCSPVMITQSGLSCPPEETLDPWLSIGRPLFLDPDQPMRMRRSAACAYAQAVMPTKIPFSYSLTLAQIRHSDAKF